MEAWMQELSCAVTVCDTEGVVVYQNEKSKQVFASYGGDLLGRSLKDCHKPESWALLQRLMAEQNSNSYTIEKKGVRKLIHQTPWYKGGALRGMVEFSIELPVDIPHHCR
jgi:Transcriptional regulator containing PAS, AAA-type ATPase, and DNA-binding domains